MSVKTALIAAKALIKTKAAARDPMSRVRRVSDVSAMCDALDAAVPSTFERKMRGLRLYFDYCQSRKTTVADVQALFDRAIEAAE